MDLVPVERVGIEHLKSLLGFGLDLASILAKVISSGGFGFDTWYRLSGLLTQAIAAFKNIADVVDEVKDLSEPEKLELVAMVESRLEINNPDVKIYVEKALKAVLTLVSLYGSFKK